MRTNLLKKAAIAFGVMALSVLAVNIFAIVPVLAQVGLQPGDTPALLQGGPTDVRDLIQTILNYLLGFLGLISVIMIIYAGFLYVTSATNEENVGKAKNIILYAIVGIVIILASAAIVNFAFGVTTGSTAASTAPTTTL